MPAPPLPFSSDPYQGPSLDDFAADLAKANTYRLSEVAANRHGFMSTRQFFRLLWQASLPLRSAGWSLGVWFALLMLMGTLFRARMMRMMVFQNYAFEAICVTLSVVLAFVVGVLTTTNKSWLLLKDLLTGEVTSVEGRLDPVWQEELGEGLKRVRGEMVPAHYYSIRQERFEVQPAAYELLRSKYEDLRPSVRLYFTPRSRQLLSIELVQADPDVYRLRQRQQAS